MSLSKPTEYGTREPATRSCAICGLRIAGQSFAGATGLLLKHVRAQHWKRTTRTSGAIEKVMSRGRRGPIDAQGRDIQERTAPRAQAPSVAADLTIHFADIAELRRAQLVSAADWLVLPGQGRRLEGDSLRISLFIGNHGYQLDAVVISVTEQTTSLFVTTASPGWSTVASVVIPGAPTSFPRGTEPRIVR